MRRHRPNYEDDSIYGIDENPEAVMHVSDCLSSIDLHIVLHKRFFGENPANQPVLMVQAVHRSLPGVYVKIAHYDPRSIGEILYRPHGFEEFDLYVRKVS